MIIKSQNIEDLLRRIIPVLFSTTRLHFPVFSYTVPISMLFRRQSIGSEQRFQMTEFVFYIEGLMQTRQQELKQESNLEKGGHRPDYTWLCTRKEEPAKLDSESLLLIRRLANKLSAVECITVAVKTESILMTTGRHLGVQDIPKLVIELLDNTQTCSLLLSVRPAPGTGSSVLKRTQSHRVKKNHCVKFENQPSYMVFSISR